MAAPSVVTGNPVAAAAHPPVQSDAQMLTEPLSIWERLRRNREANGPAFRAARIDVQDIAVLRCPSCDLEESALFWTAVGSSARTLRLACPACNRSGARYNLRRNTGRGPLDLRRLVSGVAIVAALLTVAVGAARRFGPPPDEVRYILERLWQQAASTAAEAREFVVGLARQIGL